MAPLSTFRALILTTFFLLLWLPLGVRATSGTAGGVIGIADYRRVIENFGSFGCEGADVNGDCVVDHFDVNLVISRFGEMILPTSSPIPPPPELDPSFACLDRAGPTETVSGFYNREKYEPAVENNKKFDARTAIFEYPETISHAMVSLRGGAGTGMCWAGGYFTASTSWHDLDISWRESKEGYDDTGSDRGEMNNSTSATSYHDRMTWTGLHVYNMHDGIRTNNTFNNWTIQHSWFEYIRDDCIENDSNYSGRIYDVLFDGCYSGISNQDEEVLNPDHHIVMDRVLLRMEPMPYPYKWDTKDDPVVYVDGYTIPGSSSLIPFGHGNIFKGDEEYLPTFSITHSVFLQAYDAEETIFPPPDLVTTCENNTLIWLGDPESAPDFLLEDFPGCFEIITDPEHGLALWREKVTDWHERHPGVGAHRKPDEPGKIQWPRF